jgi:hypothetical protein
MLLEGAFKYQQLDSPLREKLRRDWNRTPSWPPFVLGLAIIGAIGYAIQLNRQRNV